MYFTVCVFLLLQSATELSSFVFYGLMCGRTTHTHANTGSLLFPPPVNLSEPAPPRRPCFLRSLASICRGIYRPYRSRSWRYSRSQRLGRLRVGSSDGKPNSPRVSRSAHFRIRSVRPVSPARFGRVLGCFDRRFRCHN